MLDVKLGGDPEVLGKSMEGESQSPADVWLLQIPLASSDFLTNNSSCLMLPLCGHFPDLISHSTFHFEQYSLKINIINLMGSRF